ncbi:MoxR-like ATPase [Mariprofundus micogutta]|uniref:MoxR-like ATPase n=1 Tax=Mariprofundus micogutta TaxID=1921010 RepID=A0A1L8CMI5_9PROT|nr:MoxR family ATPase [Mariprofundus micogutta]GAV20114.1 MoxR-like ATPase [Mariprofundus micogutta]
MSNPIHQLNEQIGQRILGQEKLINRMLIALLADGHLLVEGAPGLAKTKAIKVLSDGIEGDFHRVQFTPDLLPSDLTGTEVYRPQDASFHFQAGPLFHNLILADEINRSPAKVQAALLEAMAERQITVGKVTHTLPELFLVMATQNPIEQEGTYPLPEAQLDRFLMHVTIDYPDAETEKAILRLARGEFNQQVVIEQCVTQADLFAARKEVIGMHMAESLEDYIVHLVMATRQPEKYSKQLADWIQYAASPRATIALDRCSRAHAWLSGRDYVSPEDIQAIAPDVLRHRLLLSFEAEAAGISSDDVITELLGRVAVP